ncbi:MAG: response regulator transcription factor [Bacteroidota bacterium]
MTSLLLADDHPLVLEGIKSLLLNHDQIELLAGLDSGEALLQYLEKRQADVVLLDISMPGLNGLDTLKEIQERFPDTRVLIFTVFVERQNVELAFANGARGFIYKDFDKNKLSHAILTVARGEIYRDEQIEEMLQQQIETPADHFGFRLTKREQQILFLISKGLQGPDIARILQMKESTVNRHRKNMLIKARESLDLHTMPGLVAYVIQNNLLDE